MVSGPSCTVEARLAAVRVVLNEAETRRNEMGIGMILLIVLILILAGVIPTWGHSSNWGYGPSSGVGLVLLIVVILLLMGKI